MIDLAGWSAVRTGQSRRQVVVGAAIVRDGQVLACARAHPPSTAGKWEFPGGKVETGESEIDALVRECHEELGVAVAVGQRLGGDQVLGHGRSVLRVYLASLLGSAQPTALEHAELRWLAADELDQVTWLPADQPIVAILGPYLRQPQ
ncbi:(deoxy)nucleoside triphosphate pyrophosphohydrolase [Solwaraspora sp. WMMA2056]|uniref:(deoxy)nucleoside triphosphate pyrophosphohydrolase n=1 Tax=Solwaraspora sp. WMMA2056 TaxID=3015161 RepID=UPI00259B8041|nr:(deoxy)nucleoside triphosphate pyrophosphohydrolase [Solwaraspora sp. WMMA2056]WJK44167.1 (deoxy)nucleoside triphosphate pyrophosphohydrolase [Solwaraspora sp. WMMA2056]